MGWAPNQPPKNQCKTNNSYYGRHLKTGNNTESLINKPHLAFPSPTTKKQLQEEIADKFEGEMAKSLINKPHQADSNQELKENVANKFEEEMAYTISQPPKTQCKTDNTYYGHHLKTGNNTENLINKPNWPSTPPPPRSSCRRR